jgi:RND superfamily putative drug exporter
MDYEVFMLSRIKEFYDETGNNRKSVAQGLERTGGVITSAALVMVVVAGAFATADIVVVKAIGLGMALAVAFDATIVRALLVPATMELLGKANWWAPNWVRRILPKFSVE